MHFIDNIIINKIGFITNIHDHFIYKKIIDSKVVYLLNHVSDCCCAVRYQKIVEIIFNILWMKMSIDSEKEKGIIPFEFLGVVKNSNGVDIN